MEHFPNQPEENFSPEQIFVGNISPEEAQIQYSNSLENISRKMHAITTEQLGHFFNLYEEEPNNSKGNEQETYVRLRERGFSHQEILELHGACSRGELESYLNKSINREIQETIEFMQASQEKIQRANEVLDRLFAKRNSERAEKTPTVFFGKYRGLLLGNVEDGETVSVCPSRYFPIEDVVYVRVGDVQETPPDSVIHTFVHEHVHARSTRIIDKGEQYIPFQESSATLVRSGLYYSEKESTHLSEINEAITESFTRKLMHEIDLDSTKGTYAINVQSLHLLLEFFSKQDGNRLEDQEEILFSAYTSPSGIESFTKYLESHIGKFAVELCTTLFIRPQEFNRFLQSIIKVRSGEHAEDLRLSPRGFDDPSFLEHVDEIKVEYPFLHFGENVYDPKTEEVVWSEFVAPIPREASS